MASSGIVDGHAYSLLNVKTISANGKEVKLVQVRNPYGKMEWTGDWSDTSSQWTEDTKR
jgi:hypothetical protein